MYISYRALYITGAQLIEDLLLFNYINSYILFNHTGTVARSCVHHSAVTAGWLAEDVNNEKVHKYTELNERFMFVPIDFETMGPISKGTQRFLHDRLRRMEANTKDT